MAKTRRVRVPSDATRVDLHGPIDESTDWQKRAAVEAARCRQDAEQYRQRANAVLAKARDRAHVLSQIAASVEKQAERLERVAARMSGQVAEMGKLRPMADGRRARTERQLMIAHGRTRGRPLAPELQALYDAGLTPAAAAAICGTTRDVLKQAWAKGKQFRPIRPEWAKKLAQHGVPESTWRKA